MDYWRKLKKTNNKYFNMRQPLRILFRKNYPTMTNYNLNI